MTVEELYARLDGVRRTSRGWTARCPAHADKSPSLSIREGDRGLLVHCFAGCSLDSITAALGFTVRELFYDQSADPETIRGAQRRRAEQRRRLDVRRHVDGLTVDALREAELLIESAEGLDTTGWTDAQLDEALNDLADAYTVLDGERQYEHI